MFRNSVLVTLVLLLALSGAGQPVLAQAGDPEVNVRSAMESSVPHSICVGETTSIKVWVNRTLTKKATKWKVHDYLKGITIIGAGKDPSIASLPLPVQTTGFAADLPGQAKFQIHGVKIGTTTIDFTAPVIRLPGEVLINNARSDVNYVDLTVSVNVISCDFEFTAHSDFVVPTAAIHAVINKLVLKPDAQGQVNRIGVAVHWTGSWVDIPLCTHTFSAPDSEANITGQVDNFGDLVLTISYQASTGLWSTFCGGQIQSKDPIMLNPTSPLRIDVPVSSEHYERTLRQDLEETSGEVTFIVAPQHTASGQ
jgi:hypothetical protein